MGWSSGGGLFLKDSNPNDKSEWQWACSTELLRQINVPIFLTAVGYNRFPGQSDFGETFTDNVNVLAEKSSLFSLRNTGSIDNIKNYLSSTLQDKVCYQPCPTTVLPFIYKPKFPAVRNDQSITVGVNFAFDRSALRYRDREEVILSDVCQALYKVKHEQDFNIVYIAHGKRDLNGRKYLERAGINFRTIQLGGENPDGIITQYQNIDLMLGMRGHAQMIPFGQGCPIISLVSHPKLGYFLNDINMNECGVDLHSSTLIADLEHSIRAVIENIDYYRFKIETERQRLWAVTKNNMHSVRSALGI